MNEETTSEILAEILKWQKVQGIKTIVELVPILLDTTEKRIVYEKTDGSSPQSKVAGAAHVAVGTVSNWWRLWYSYGILTKEGRRYKKIISLRELKLPLTVPQEVEHL